MTRAMRLIDEGDIAGARLLLHHLAEQGEADAAYELGRTFDPDVLAVLGAEGLGADKATALNWYERASETGNKQAKERLRILASLSD
jgi:TPR repeat protein